MRPASQTGAQAGNGCRQTFVMSPAYKVKSIFEEAQIDLPAGDTS